MIAIREIQEVKEGVVTIALPASFHAKRVEVIVLQIDDGEDPSTEQTSSLQALLLAAPPLTNDEAQEYENVREWMAEWHATDF